MRIDRAQSDRVRVGARASVSLCTDQKEEWMAKTIRISDRPIGGGLEV